MIDEVPFARLRKDWIDSENVCKEEFLNREKPPTTIDRINFLEDRVQTLMFVLKYTLEKLEKYESNKS